MKKIILFTVLMSLIFMLIVLSPNFVLGAVCNGGVSNAIIVNHASCDGVCNQEQACMSDVLGRILSQSECGNYYIKYTDGKCVQCGWYSSMSLCGDYGEDNNVYCTCPGACVPNCVNKQCGSNGCGGSCGSCSSGQVCQNGQCIIACPLPRLTGAATGTATLPPCKECDKDNNLVNKPDGTPCDDTTNNIVGGYCENGICKARTCKNVYGEDYITCPAKDEKENPGPNCCKKGELCCNKDDKGNIKNNPICCNPNTNGKDTFNCFFKNVITDINRCQPKDASKCKDNEIYCKGASLTKGVAKCCPKKDQYNDNIECGENWGPICVKQSCNTAKGEHSCPPNKKDYKKRICCQENDECKKVKVKWTCYATSCKDGRPPCQSLDKDKSFSICCNPGTVCFAEPSGYPRCVEVKSTPTSTSANPSTSTASTNTNTVSFWMIRDKNNFVRNGEAYHLTLDKDVKFSKNISLEFNYAGTGISASNVQIYKYEEGSLNGCVDNVIESNPFNISSSSKIIEVTGLKITIPQGASTSNIMKIDRVNITCKEQGYSETDNYFLSFDVTLNQVYEYVEKWKKEEVSSGDLLTIIGFYNNPSF